MNTGKLTRIDPELDLALEYYCKKYGVSKRQASKMLLEDHYKALEDSIKKETKFRLRI